MSTHLCHRISSVFSLSSLKFTFLYQDNQNVIVDYINIKFNRLHMITVVKISFFFYSPGMFSWQVLRCASVVSKFFHMIIFLLLSTSEKNASGNFIMRHTPLFYILFHNQTSELFFLFSLRIYDVAILSLLFIWFISSLAL